MNKSKYYLSCLSLVNIVFMLVLVFSFNFALIGQESKGKMEKAENDALQNFSVMTEVQTVPGHLKLGFESISGKETRKYLQFLTSDLLEGRETATPGYEIASEFVGTLFGLWDILPAGDYPVKATGRGNFFSRNDDAKEEKKERGYFQEIEIREILEEVTQITVELRKGSVIKSRGFNPMIDYEFRPTNNNMLSAPIVFVGYGIFEKEIKYDDYGKLDVAGKIVMMLTGVPGKDNPNSPFNKGALKEKYASPRNPMRHYVAPQIKMAQEKGAAAVILVESSTIEKPDVPKDKLAARKINDNEAIYPGERRRMTLVQGPPNPWESLPTVRISRAMAEDILKFADQNLDKLQGEIEKDLKSHSFALPGVSMEIISRVEEQLVKCRNVLGYIEGSDPKLKDEVVVIGAHLDHLGKRGDYVFNGADDNGSGSVAIMAAARAFAINPVKPKRSILFALWTGEEKGLLGSRYYTTHPFFPLQKTVAYINLDMVSREWSRERFNMMLKRFNLNIPEEFSKTVDMAKFMSIQYSDMKVREALIEGNRFAGLHMVLRETIPGAGSGGSDHASFSAKKIPLAAFFGAMTDDYHKASDSIEKVNLDIIERSARLTWLAAFFLADK